MVKFDLRLEENSKCVKKKLDCKLEYIFGIIYFFQRKGRQLLKENNERVRKEEIRIVGIFIFPIKRKTILVKFDLRLKEDSECVKKKLDCKLGYIFGIIYFFQRKGRQLLKENNECVKKN